MEMTLFQRIEAGVGRRLLNASDTFVERMTKTRWELDGEVLDRRAQYMFAMGRFAERSMPSMSPENARRYYARLCRVLEAPPPEIAHASDLALELRSGPRKARVYYPQNAAGTDARLPGLVYYHGGGFTIGSVETHDTLCRRLCEGAGCAVVSIDYRLAPENPFPAAVEDCYDAYRAVRDRADELGIDTNRIAVGGDSAGGNLAAVVSSLARDQGDPQPCAQLLIYPGVGTVDHPGRGTPELQTGYGLDAETTRWFFENYAGTDTKNDPLVAPLYLSSHADLPPAIVVTAHFDLLCAEGVEYVHKLESARTPVTHLHVTDLPHGFGTMSILPRARAVISELSAALGRRLAAPSIANRA